VTFKFLAAYSPSVSAAKKPPPSGSAYQGSTTVMSVAAAAGEAPEELVPGAVPATALLLLLHAAVVRLSARTAATADPRRTSAVEVVRGIEKPCLRKMHAVDAAG
jgi:hypothetical protein